MGQGATILGCLGPRLSDDERSFFRAADPWGFILFARNVETPEQLLALTAELRDSVGRDAPILIDQEGGRVQRMTPPQWQGWRPPMDQVRAAGPKNAARSMYLRYRLIAHELRSGGIDANWAPMVDVARAETHPFLLNRCYGEVPEAVAEIGRAVAQGCLDGGVLPVLKHIPGHGLTQVDSHHDLPRVTSSAEVLDTVDFAPFLALCDLPLGMTGHLLFDAYDAEHPATTSPEMIAVIRQRIGFDGLLMTDDISMEALSGSLVDRSRASIAAGCDLVLHCNGKMAEMEEVVQAAGSLTSMAAARADRALAARRAPDNITPDRLEAELAQLLEGRVYG